MTPAEEFINKETKRLIKLRRLEILSNITLMTKEESDVFDLIFTGKKPNKISDN